VQAGRQYDEGWKKYEAELAKWKSPAARSAKRDDGASRRNDAPRSDFGHVGVRGQRRAAAATRVRDARMKLTGASIEGRLTDPMSGEEPRCAARSMGTT